MEKSFKNLLIWQRSMDFSQEVYKLSLRFPSEERYGLTSQIQRAALSVPANISEGYARSSNKEFAKFLYISLGSLAEVDTFLDFSCRIKYIDTTTFKKLTDEKEAIRKMILALLTKVKK